MSCLSDLQAAHASAMSVLSDALQQAQDEFDAAVQDADEWEEIVAAYSAWSRVKRTSRTSSGAWRVSGQWSHP